VSVNSPGECVESVVNKSTKTVHAHHSDDSQ